MHELNTTNLTDKNQLKNLITLEISAINDILEVGSNLNSSDSTVSIIKTYSQTTNDELNTKEERLKKEIAKKLAIIERCNRDFSDVRDTLPEKLEKKNLHIVEDYTMAVLSICLIFVILVFVYYTVQTSTDTMTGLLKGAGIGLLFGLFSCIVIYQIA
jgi:hypothetical protein